MDRRDFVRAGAAGAFILGGKPLGSLLPAGEKGSRASARAADRVIRDHPYQTVGIAFGVGLLVGVLVNRK